MKLSRDPAVYLSLFATALRLMAAFWWHVSDDQQAILNAGATAVAAAVVAIWVKRDGQLPAALGVIQALLAIAVGFGAHLSAENQAIIMSFVGTAAAIFIRTQVVAPVAADGTRQA